MNTRPALVTGANGFLGSHLADLLLTRGYAVRCLVRRTGNLRWLTGKPVDLVYGDFDREAALGEALAGVGTVFHLAGATRAPNEDEYMRVNRDGTRRLAEAAGAAGATRFVLVSSLAASGPSHPGRPNREEDPPAPTSAYGRSKLAGEMAVEEAAQIPWTVVRPSAVYGARDVDFPKLFRLVKRGLAPEFTGARQEISAVDARDVVDGILAAAECEAAAGRVYFLTHPEILSWRRVGEIAARALGRPYRRIPIPLGLLPSLAGLAGLAGRLTGRPNELPADRVADLRAPSWSCSPERAAGDFGFRPRFDAEHGIPDAVRWCVGAGWL